MRLLIALVLLAAATAAAQTPAPAAKSSHFVVFNRLGPNFAKAQADPALRETLLAHRRLYLDLADDGRLIAGGRMDGDPVLGISVFRSDVDRAAIKAMLEADPSVRAGIIAVEFREWQMQMGGIARPAER